MFESFKKIIIKGGYFEDEVTLEVFKGTDPLSIIYGRNGSGKTTIAHCMKIISESEEQKEARLQRIAVGEETDYTVSSEDAIIDEHKKDVFVFDEEFLRDNVRVEKDGLNTIVMLGQQVELDDQISIKQEELRIKTEAFNLQDELVKKYESVEENISPLFYWNQIKDGLRADEGWAEIDRRVKGNKVMSRITDDVISTLAGMPESSDSYERLRAQLMSDLLLYQQSENAHAIEWDVSSRSLPGELDELKELLQRPIDSPELNEREQRLVAMLAKHPEHSSHETKQMLDEGWPFCPICLREIGDADKEYIIQTLTHILNKEAEVFEGKLKQQLDVFADMENDLPEFQGGLNKMELGAAVAASIRLNKALSSLRDCIEWRRRNVYKPMREPFKGNIDEEYYSAKTEWENAMGQVKKNVSTFNETVSKRDKLFNKVRQENNVLARKQLASSLMAYKQALENETRDRSKLQNLKDEKEELETAIKELKAQKERTDIALEYINMELQYVFYSNHKVRLVAGDGCYKLMVRGKHVKPKRISVGERNVLGLCYFFAMLFSGKQDDEKYASEYLLVIDDPVSSFDYGNRLGVMSLLRYQFNRIIKGNTNSRILVMSHDLQSVFDLVKIRGDLKGGRDRDKSFFELEDKQMKPQTVRNEYHKLLTHVYQYAISSHPEDIEERSDLGIGNIMRRLMEAFSSFCYNKSFEEMMRTEGVLNLVPSERRDYYENFMCRLTLNSGSHEEEHVYTLNSLTPFFSSEEKQQTAKSVLLFLLYVNEPHIRGYLKNEEVTVIESWKGEEDGWMTVEEGFFDGDE